MSGIAFDMNGRTALVTGASSGIGRQLCLQLAAAGAHVIAGARRMELLESLVEEITAAGGKALATGMDVADAGSIAAAYDAGEKAFGPVHTVYANAGIHTPGSALELSMQDFDRIMQINLIGVILTAREGAARLIKAGPEVARRGRVVIVSSIRGFVPVADNIAYCSSKAAAIMAGKIMALEWAKVGINVNTVCPGVIVTEISEWFYQTDAGKQRLARYPRNRLMDIDDIMTPLLYLGSDQSRAVTGSVVVIDDGQTLG